MAETVNHNITTHFTLVWHKKAKKYLQNYTKSIQQSQQFVLLNAHFPLFYWVAFVKNLQGV